MHHPLSRRARRCVGLAALLGPLLLTACEPGSTIALAKGLVTPVAVTASPDGGLYVVDQGDCTVKKVDTSGTLSTVAGTGSCGYSGDGGAATSAKIAPVTTSGSGDLVGGIQVAPDGTIYLADTGNGRIRTISPQGTISTLRAGLGAWPNGVGQLALGADGSVYFTAGLGGVRRLTSGGALSTISTDSARSIAVTPAGAIAFENIGLLGSPGLRLYDPTSGAVTATGDSESSPAIAFDAHGYRYAAYGSRIVRTAPDGSQTVLAGTGAADPATATQSGDALDLHLSPHGLATTPNGALLVTSGHAVYRIEAPATFGTTTASGCNTRSISPITTTAGSACKGQTCTAATSAARTSPAPT